MASPNAISIDSLISAISDELTQYRNEVVEQAVVKETKQAMKDLVEKTKATAPVGNRKKHYKENVSSKVLQEKPSATGLAYSELWYVKGSDYRLSHLLNNGHALRDGGRYDGTQFIAKATEQVEKTYLEKLQNAIENGG